MLMDYAQRKATERALHEFDEFCNAWLGPAALHQIRAVAYADESVRNAVAAIAVAARREPVGYMVCQTELVTKADPDHRKGIIYTAVGNIFERADQGRNVLDYCRERKAGEFVICELEQI